MGLLEFWYGEYNFLIFPMFGLMSFDITGSFCWLICSFARSIYPMKIGINLANLVFIRDRSSWKKNELLKGIREDLHYSFTISQDHFQLTPPSAKDHTWWLASSEFVCTIQQMKMSLTMHFTWLHNLSVVVFFFLATSESYTLLKLNLNTCAIVYRLFFSTI